MTPLQAALARAVKLLLRRAAEKDWEHRESRPDSRTCTCVACVLIRDIEMEER